MQNPNPISDNAPIDALRNLGPVSVRQLKEVGITCVGDLRRIGAIEAYHRVKFIEPNRISLNALYAYNAALLDIPWRAITADMRQIWRYEAGLETYGR